LSQDYVMTIWLEIGLNNQINRLNFGFIVAWVLHWPLQHHLQHMEGVVLVNYSPSKLQESCIEK